MPRKRSATRELDYIAEKNGIMLFRKPKRFSVYAQGQRFAMGKPKCEWNVDR
jgi:hypothetical protein